MDQNNKTYKHNEGKSWPQILAVCVVTIGSFTNGVLYAWSSPYALVISRDKENYDISEEEVSYFIVFQPLGMIFASLFFFKIAELLGRKKSLVFLAVPQIASWIVTIFARTKWDFYVARFIAGAADAILFCTIPPYVGEVTTPSIRGYFGNFPVCFFNGGTFFITALGSYCDIQTSSYICIGFPVLYVALLYILPESPYQLIKDNKFDQARESIRWFIRKSDVEEEFLNVKADVERQMSERGKWKDLIKIESNIKALRAGIFLRFSQHLSGIAVFAAYTQVVFEKAGGSLGPEYSSMIFLFLLWVLSLSLSVAVEKFGRKTSYFYSLLCCGTILVIMSVYFFLEQYELANLEKLTWFPLAGMIIYISSYCFGIGIVPTLMLGELFSASVKSKGLSVLALAFGLAVFVATNLFNLFLTSIGLYAPFLLFGACCLVSTVLTLRWVPETKGKTLEQIQQFLKK